MSEHVTELVGLGELAERIGWGRLQVRELSRRTGYWPDGTFRGAPVWKPETADKVAQAYQRLSEVDKADIRRTLIAELSEEFKEETS